MDLYPPLRSRCLDVLVLIADPRGSLRSQDLFSWLQAWGLDGLVTARGQGAGGVGISIAVSPLSCPDDESSEQQVGVWLQGAKGWMGLLLGRRLYGVGISGLPRCVWFCIFHI